MTGVARDQASAPPSNNIGGIALFLRRWAANPLRMGSIVPSSPALCGHVVRIGWPADRGVVLELGSGTGVISRAFLNAGLPPERLVAVEVDPELAASLRDGLPGVTVLEGDARHLPDLLPRLFQHRIATVICGIPLVLLPAAKQRAYIDAMTAVAPGLGFLHYSYCVTSPLPVRAHRLTARREAWTPLNIPPASVWRYTPCD